MFWKNKSQLSPLSNDQLNEAMPAIVTTLEALTKQNKIQWVGYASDGVRLEYKNKKLRLSIYLHPEYSTNNKIVTNFRMSIDVNSDDLDNYIERRFTSFYYKELYIMAHTQIEQSKFNKEQVNNAEFLKILTEILAKLSKTK